MAARVLLVHGDPFTRRSLVTALRCDDFIVGAVATGAAAFTACTVTPPAVVLTGALLPDTDAWALVQQLHAAARTASIPCVLFTTLQGLVDLNRAFALGFDDVVARPCESEELRARVRGVLARGGTPRDLHGGERLRGILPARGLPALLRLLAAQRHRGTIELERDEPANRCVLQLHDGQLIDARVEAGPALHGAEAVLFALTWRSGTFLVQGDARTAAARVQRGRSHER